MNVISEDQARQAISYANKLLVDFDKTTPNAVYHVGEHTQDIRNWGRKIGVEEGLDPGALRELDVLLSFHDTGLVNNTDNTEQNRCRELIYEGHEAAGSKKMINYAREIGVPEESINRMSLGVLGTNLFAPRETLYARIAHDADISSIGRVEAKYWADKLRAESRLNPTTSPLFQFANDDSKWLTCQVAFYKSREWQTNGAEKLFGAQKAKNVAHYENLLKGA